MVFCSSDVNGTPAAGGAAAGKGSAPAAPPARAAASAGVSSFGTAGVNGGTPVSPAPSVPAARALPGTIGVNVSAESAEGGTAADPGIAADDGTAAPLDAAAEDSGAGAEVNTASDCDRFISASAAARAAGDNAASSLLIDKDALACPRAPPAHAPTTHAAKSIKTARFTRLRPSMVHRPHNAVAPGTRRPPPIRFHQIATR
jgi:hypothetical protein